MQLHLREWREGDAPSDYWGWVSSERQDRYTMVWPSEIQFEMCFHSGSKPPEESGRGRKVHLVVEEVVGGPTAGVP